MTEATEPTKSEIKQQILQLKAAITQAIQGKQAKELKLLRRKQRHLKAATRRLARSQKVLAAKSAAASETPAA